MIAAPLILHVRTRKGRVWHRVFGEDGRGWLYTVCMRRGPTGEMARTSTEDDPPEGRRCRLCYGKGARGDG